MRKEKIRRSKACHLVCSLYATAGYQVSRRLRIRSEHLFAEAKNEHSMGRARSRGLARVQIQMELIGIVQNLKRLAKHSRRNQPARAALPRFSGLGSPLYMLLTGLAALLRHSLPEIRPSSAAWAAAT